MHKGNLYIVSSPSGGGKTSLLRELITKLDNIEMSVSYTTRSMRPNENDGVDYHFISEEKYKGMESNGDFLESASVFGNCYGTSKILTEKKLSEGIDVILVIDWQGAKIVRSKVKDVKSIFILPPSKKELGKRLAKRAEDTLDVIAKRMSKSINEMSHYTEYDYIVVNDDFNVAVDMLKSIIVAARLEKPYQEKKLEALIKDLLD